VKAIVAVSDGFRISDSDERAAPRAPRALMPSLHHRMRQSISSSCDRKGDHAIPSARGSQRRGPCHGHRVLVLPCSPLARDCVRARRWLRPHARPFL